MMKRTEKSIANSRQKSMANSRQKSIFNSRQRTEPTAGKATKGLRPRQGEVRG